MNASHGDAWEAPMGKPVTKPQREVLLRRGPRAGQVITVDLDLNVIEVDGYRYVKDPQYKDYFVYDEE